MRRLLAQADLGLAMEPERTSRSKLPTSRWCAVTFVPPPHAISLSMWATLRTIKGNLFWAFAYNGGSDSGALCSWNPIIAGAAMAFSSVFAVCKACACGGSTAISALVVDSAES